MYCGSWTGCSRWRLGCRPGRNALHLASAGFTVDAVDLSPAAISWAKDRARDADAEVHFQCGDAALRRYRREAVSIRAPRCPAPQLNRRTQVHRPADRRRLRRHPLHQINGQFGTA
ncbi:MAG: class I SAM-dependent methyltransferase [Pseudonocardiaceae bacterium]